MSKPSKPKRPKLRQRTGVLVVLNSDGFVEVYGSLGFQSISRSGTRRMATRLKHCDEYLDHVLPRPFKELYYPNKLQTVGLCRRITVADEINRRVDLAVLRELRALATPAAVPAAIARARRGGAIIEVFCGPQSGNGKPHRDVVVRNIDGKEYRDKIDTDSGFQRQGLLERRPSNSALKLEDLKPLDREMKFDRPALKTSGRKPSLRESHRHVR